MDKKQLKAASKIIKHERGDLSIVKFREVINEDLHEANISHGTVQGWLQENPRISIGSMLALLAVGGWRKQTARDVLAIIAPEFSEAVLK